jgi:hypothetical protein
MLSQEFIRHGMIRLAAAAFTPTLELMKRRVLLLAAVSAAGCAASDVKPLGPPRPAKPLGCPVAFFARTAPTYEYVDIARVETRCRYSTDQVGCSDELRVRACALGGDTVYGFARAATRDHTLVSAHVAYRRRGADVAAGAALCAPACGPGQKCEEGECVPACSPHCTQAQICRAQGTCGGPAAEPAASDSTPASPLPETPMPASLLPETPRPASRPPHTPAP